MLTLIIGGARAGKSDLALRLAAAAGDHVTFIATMTAGDNETRARIAAHRASRPAAWRTVEEPYDLRGALDAAGTGTVVIDCLTLWVANHLMRQFGEADAIAAEAAAQAVASLRDGARALVDRCAGRRGEVIAVTNEVGLSVVPAHALGRVFRDALGAVNREAASRAERTIAVVAGLAVDLRGAGAAPVESFGGGR